MKVYVSLCSIFQRQGALYETLKSLLLQSRLPDRVYLFLSEDPYLLDSGFKNREITFGKLSKFLKDNSELFKVVWVQNTGPYRKLLNLLENKWEEDCVIITVDDDTVYSKELVKTMCLDYKKENCSIGYRGVELVFDNLDDIEYTKNKEITIPKYFNFATGKGGILYSPKFFDKVKSILFDRSLYTKVAETHDDVWFNLLRICNGVKLSKGSLSNYLIRDLTDKDSALCIRKNTTAITTKFLRDTITELRLLGFLTIGSY